MTLQRIFGIASGNMTTKSTKLSDSVQLENWEENPLDPEMIPLINALNDHGIMTKQCCSGHGEHQAQVSIDLNQNNLGFYVQQGRLILQWDLKKKRKE